MFLLSELMMSQSAVTSGDVLWKFVAQRLFWIGKEEGGLSTFEACCCWDNSCGIRQ